MAKSFFVIRRKGVFLQLEIIVAIVTIVTIGTIKKIINQ